MWAKRRLPPLAAGLLCFSRIVFGGFASTETILPAVGRGSGQGIEFYTTVWATNLTGTPISFTFEFLKQGQANTNPAKFTDTLAAGETKVYENVVGSKLDLANALGGARITSTGEILVAERIFNQAPGADLGDTEGLFFAGVPKSFSISAGQSASIQGINQGGAEDFRYNFALVETGGGSPTVNVQVFSGSGTLLGQKSYPLQPYEQLQPNVAEVVPGFSSTNARITATVTGGSGSVLLAGAQVANVSHDSSGFEMSFRDDILGSGGGTAGVTSLNGLTGALTIAHGANTTVNVNGKTITIDAVSGSGTGLTAVAHDNSLTGSGTVALPLAIGNGQVVRSLNGLHEAVTLAAGTNVTLTPSSQTLTIASQGLTLPFSGNGNFTVTNDDFHVSSTAIKGIATSTGSAVTGESAGGEGVFGSGSIGVLGLSGTGSGVEGESNGDAVLGQSGGGGFNAGVRGINNSTGIGVYGETFNGVAWAVYGNSNGGGYAGYFDGNVHVQGTLEKPGGSFKIDHPLDPEHRYLSHSFVESPDMKNIYDGVATLDASGSAAIGLPEWFEALNRDFRYQLTPIGTPQPGLYVAQKVRGNEFRIGGGVPGAEVSWMVTGIRHDPWADAHRIPVDQWKPDAEQGTYLDPAVYAQPEEKSASAAKRRVGLSPVASRSDR